MLIYFLGFFLKMGNISAVICELNPLHRGHKYIFDEAKKSCDTLVAIMSGNFVQRGECAIFHKYARADMALQCGADLVVELPFPWSCAPAEFFALGAMKTVISLGIDNVVFGSECGDIELLKKAAKISRTEEFQREVETEYTENVGYAAARERAAKRLIPEAASVFCTSNDMLALEYIISAEKLGYEGDFVAVKRFTDDRYISASEIRKAVRNGNSQDVIYSIPETIKKDFCENLNDTALVSRLEELEFSSFRLGFINKNTFDFESGILSRIEKCANTSANGREMLEKSSTKKYTDARIRRAALFALCNVKKEHLTEPPEFTVLLAANDKGRKILSETRKNDSYKIITKPSVASDSEAWERQVFADSLYTMLFDKVKEASFFIKSTPTVK